MLINLICGCTPSAPAFIQAVFVLDIIYTTFMLILNTASYQTSTKSAFEKIYNVVTSLLFFLFVAFCFGWFLYKKRFNSVWHKIYSVLRMVWVAFNVLVYVFLFIFYIYLTTQRDIKHDGAFVFWFVFNGTICVYFLANIYLSGKLLKISFRRGRERNRVETLI